MEVGIVLRAAEVDGGTGWDAVRAYALAAEASGIDSVWMFDHFFHDPGSGPVEGMHEAWTVISAVAAITERVGIGQLVMCTGFRNPGLLAKMAVTLDAVSGGRVTLGLGAGSHAPEFTAFGYPTDHRVGRFEEALLIVSALLRGEQVTFEGRWHRFQGALLAPAPSRHIPILVAADGPRMRRLAVRYADAWATAWYGRPDETLRAGLADIEAALADRTGPTLSRTAGVVVLDPTRRWPPDDEPTILGDQDEITEALRAYASLGFDRLIVNLQPMTEDWLVRFADRVAIARGRIP